MELIFKISQNYQPTAKTWRGMLLGLQRQLQMQSDIDGISGDISMHTAFGQIPCLDWNCAFVCLWNGSTKALRIFLPCTITIEQFFCQIFGSEVDLWGFQFTLVSWCLLVWFLGSASLLNSGQGPESTTSSVCIMPKCFYFIMFFTLSDNRGRLYLQNRENSQKWGIFTK